eukprot:1139954-Pelagomonas_calceolata.AAC.1
MEVSLLPVSLAAQPIERIKPNKIKKDLESKFVYRPFFYAVTFVIPKMMCRRTETGILSAGLAQMATLSTILLGWLGKRQTELGYADWKTGYEGYKGKKASVKTFDC